MENKMLSFHNKQEVKDFYLKRVKMHREADEIIKGVYWEDGRGCGIGCTVHSRKHYSYETELGITWRLALVEDSLFEKLPNDLAKEFPIQFLEAMPIGVDTNIIFKKFIIWNLSDKKEGLIYHIKDKKAIELLKEISATYKKSFKKEIKIEVWKDLEKRASASASAYDYDSAYTYISAYTYAYATPSATDYPEWNEKFNERILKMRNKLLQLIKTAK